MNPRAPRRVTVATPHPYDVQIGRGVSAGLTDFMRARFSGRRAVLITDQTVGKLHAGPVMTALGALGAPALTHSIPPGEIHKTRATKDLIEDELAAGRCGRDTVILALGGGVVTDLAGFVAATWHRGVPWIALPTTLLGMLDASIGGKTGVDHPAGKNLIGAFHQPAAVFADTAWLETLPQNHFTAAMAEGIKAAMARDADLFAALRRDRAALIGRDDEALTAVLERCCAIKAEVVVADEREGDLRQILNFGHTIGHALEALSGYTMLHGEAVAIGMVAEARIAVAQAGLPAGDARALEDTLQLYGLPTALPARTREAGAILEAARADKKARAGVLRYALPSAIGAMARCAEGYGIPVPDSIARDVLERMA